MDEWPVEMKGTLKGSINLKQVHLFRFHKKRHLDTSSVGLARTFLDGNHSVENNSRFAGAYCNPGIFFAVDQRAAVSEFRHYNPEFRFFGQVTPDVFEVLSKEEAKEVCLVECVANLDRVLDLIDTWVLYDIIKLICGEPTVTNISKMHVADLLRCVSDTAKGGNPLTDRIGRGAWLSGYSGVMFMSARAIRSLNRPDTYQLGTIQRALETAQFGDMMGAFSYLLERIREEAANIVVFRGAKLVQAAERFRIWETDAPSDWILNDLARADISEIEQNMVRLGGLDGDMLVERCDVIFRERPILEIRTRSY